MQAWPCRHRRPRGREGALPRPRLTRAEHGNPARVRAAFGGAVGRPREGRKPRAGQDAQEAKAGSRKAAGNRRRHARLPRRGPGITGRIPGLVPGRERALTWAGEPMRPSARTAGTEGQVGRDDGLQLHHPGLGGRPVGRPRRGRGDGESGPDSERTGGPAPRCARPVGRDRLAGARGAGTAAAAADLHGGAGAGLAEGPEPAEADAAEPRQHAGQRAAGDAAQRRAQDRRDRRGGRADSEARAAVAVRVHQSISSWRPARSSACISRRHQTVRSFGRSGFPC